MSDTVVDLKEEVPPQMEFRALVPRAEYERFRRHLPYPTYGAVSWFINTALASFNDLMDEQPALTTHVTESVRVTVDLKRFIRKQQQAQALGVETTPTGD